MGEKVAGSGRSYDQVRGDSATRTRKRWWRRHVLSGGRVKLGWISNFHCFGRKCVDRTLLKQKASVKCTTPLVVY